MEHNKPVNPRYKTFKVLEEPEKEVTYLDKEEIDLLYAFDGQRNLNVPGRYKPVPYRTIIDITVFQCLTGLRYSDLKASKFDKERLAREEILSGTTKKTKGYYQIPLKLDPRIKELLEKYEYNFNILEEPAYNRLVKQVLQEFYNHHQNHPRLKIYLTPLSSYRYKLREPVEFKYHKWELYSSHCNRRSAGTNLARRGLSEAQILKTFGSKSIKEVRKYIDQDINSIIERL
jgi:hypothetical protein